MHIYYEPQNVNQWNIFEEVKNIGHIEPFLAVKSMKIGDMVLFHVGTQNKKYESGIYAYGTVVKAPYICKDRPGDYCNNKNSVDVRIDAISYDKPLISHDNEKEFITFWRSVHQIDSRHYALIMKLLYNCD